MNDYPNKCHLKGCAFFVAIVIILIACSLGYVAQSWHKTNSVVRGFIADPHRELTEAEAETVFRYIEGRLLARAPWRPISEAMEDDLIKTSLQHIGDEWGSYIFLAILAKWKYWHEFRNFPTLASSFLDRRDKAAGIALTWVEGSSPGILLSVNRIKALLEKPSDELFQMSIILSTIGMSTFDQMTDDYISLRERGLLGDKVWDVIAKRMHEAKQRANPP